MVLAGTIAYENMGLKLLDLLSDVNRSEIDIYWGPEKVLAPSEQRYS
jgi:catalase (peroxidase I)